MAEPRTITIVLVHGAFAESLSNWKPVLGLLLAKGYKVVAAPNPLRGVSSDTAYVSSFLNTIDGPIILVGHSVGVRCFFRPFNSLCLSPGIMRRDTERHASLNDILRLRAAFRRRPNR